MMVITLLLFAASCIAALVAAGCATTPRIYNLENPSDVKRLYTVKCGSCHTPYSAGDYTPEQWPVWIDTYAADASLTRAEQDAITIWIVEESRKIQAKRDERGGPSRATGGHKH